MKNIKILIFVFLSTLIINNSYAQTSVNSSIVNSSNVKIDITTMKEAFNNAQNIDTATQIPIDFSLVNWSHPNANIGAPNSATYLEALNSCENLMWLDRESNTRQPDSFTGGLQKYQFWVACMKSFSPYLESQNIDSVSCSAIPVKSWGGNCLGSIPNGSDFDIVRVNHNSLNNEYQGYANYECKNGQWFFLDGFCIDDPDVCEGPIDVSWPVTEPAWAVLGNSTEARYDPKSDCESRVEGNFLSGTLIGGLTAGVPNVPLESPPMNAVERASYDPTLSTENTYFRCFNGDFVINNPETARCVYQPKSCSQQSYTTADGCQFNIPDISHNENTTVNNPFPVNSTGSLTARCFDGDIEILTESCQLSCLNESRLATVWDSEFSNDPVDCSYPSLPLDGSRTVPESVLSINNINPLMTGQYSWRCVDGFFQFEGSSCMPKNCDADLPASSYVGVDTLNVPVMNNTCNHNAWTNGFEHNSTISLPTIDTGTTGNAYYTCSYGVVSASANDVNTCVIQGPSTCTSNQPLFADPAYTITGPSIDPSCEINCRNINGGLNVDCRQECTPSNPICDCSSPCGQTGEELLSTGGSCSYDAVCSGDSTALCTFNDGTEFVTEACNGADWVTSSTRCEPYETPLVSAPPAPPSATGCGIQNVNWSNGPSTCYGVATPDIVGGTQNVEAIGVQSPCDIQVLTASNGNNAILSCGADGLWSVDSVIDCSCP